jgi:hypothetical protein
MRRKIEGFMLTQSSLEQSTKEVSLNSLWWVIPVATALAAAANVIFYYIVTRWLGEPLLFPEQFPPTETSPMPVADVILFSLIFSLGAAIVFILVAIFSRRPIRTYLIISSIVLVFSFIPPLMVPTPPVTMPAKLTLVAMHIIGAIAVVGTMTGLSQQRAEQ